MKKNITILLVGILISLSSLSKAQQFWIENWTGGTGAQGTLTYTGPNGAWTIQQTGTNDADSNAWYFSNEEQAIGRGGCGSASGSKPSAHVGNTASAPLLGIAGADNGATIDDGANTNTNLRLQSPVINCTGKSNITLSFNYIMGDAAGNDYATVYYYNGTTWSLLATPVATTTCGSGQGTWTYYSIALPASANNNANVQIGFNWINNTASYDDNSFLASNPLVSFAVDSVVLSTPIVGSAPVANFIANDTSICVGDTVRFTDLSTNSPTSWKWTFENGNPATSTKKDTSVIYSVAGYDSVKLVVKNSSGSDSITMKKYIHVFNCGAGIENVADNNSINLYPNPAKNSINLAFAKAISGNAKIEITDIMGRIVNTQLLTATSAKSITMDISGIASGMYIVKITAGNTTYFQKFIKQ